MPWLPLPWRVASRRVACARTLLFAAAVVGGVMLGYGARIAFGCNIGAYFSGVASTSLHGWVWLASAFCGNIVGTRLRPWFGLAGDVFDKVAEKRIREAMSEGSSITSRRRGASTRGLLQDA